ESGPYTSVCWARTSLGPALIHREFALYGRDNRPGNVAHALLDPDRVLGPHVVLALGVLDWAADGAAADELTPGEPLFGLSAERLIALAQGRAATLRAAARDHGPVLTRVAETLLARPRLGVTLLRRDTGPDPVPLLWGVFDLISHLVQGSWSFSTYETGDDATRPRFVVVPRWPAGDSPTRARIKPGDSPGGDVYAEAARLLVACYTTRPWAETRNLLRALRSSAELGPEAKAHAIVDVMRGGRIPAQVSLTKPGPDNRPYPPKPLTAPPGWAGPRDETERRGDPAGAVAAGDSPGWGAAVAANGAGSRGRPEDAVATHERGGTKTPSPASTFDGRPPRASGGSSGTPGPDNRARRVSPAAAGAPDAPPKARPAASREAVAPPVVERPYGPTPPQPDTRYLPVAFPMPEEPRPSDGGRADAPRDAAPRQTPRPPEAPAAPPRPTGMPGPEGVVRASDAGPAPRHRSPSAGAAALAAAAAALDTPVETADATRAGAPDWSANTGGGASAGPGRHAKRADPAPAAAPLGPPERAPRGWEREGWIEDGASDAALHALVGAARLLAREPAGRDGEFHALLDQVDLVTAAVGLGRAEEPLLPALVERVGALVTATDRLPTPREQTALERVLAGLDGPMRELDRCGLPRHRIAAVTGQFAAYVLDGCQTGSMAAELAVVVRNLDTVSGTYRPYQQHLIRAVVAHGSGAHFYAEIGRLWAASRSLLPDPADPLEG
ncbi:MAG TPA: hypothetical protein VLH10_20345, partial [Yinghuangia sp.]|nr:hypothetical protein [Yinghuangia sp.]